MRPMKCRLARRERTGLALVSRYPSRPSTSTVGPNADNSTSTVDGIKLLVNLFPKRQNLIRMANGLWLGRIDSLGDLGFEIDVLSQR